MKLIVEFQKFLEDVVNLNATRITTLVTRVESIESFLLDSDLEVRIQRFSTQGSWAHKTIITPPGDGGFDADLLAFVEPMPGWEAADYVIAFHKAFLESGVYKDKVTLGTRCITLDYAGDFNIDIVPCVVARPGAITTYEVCNRTDNEFEPTDSEAYTAWVEERNTWTGQHKLREVTRLLKYLRDVKLTFTCKSILLTTLLGERITQVDVFFQNTEFPDLPTAFRTLVGRLDDYLQAHADLHDVCNPVLPSESFIRHWDDDKYDNFREMVHKYRGWIDDAYLESDEAVSLTKWQRIFQDEFGKSSNAVAKIAENAIVPVSVDARQFRDAVEVVKRHGSAVLAGVRQMLPWMKVPQWRMAISQRVLIRATSHMDRSGSTAIGLVLSGQILAASIHLLFEAQTSNGIPYASIKDSDVQWQVVNTDRAAWLADSLRGGFYSSKPRGKRWESTLYRGVHWVQAFVIRRRDRTCVACSERFFIVIG